MSELPKERAEERQRLVDEVSQLLDRAGELIARLRADYSVHTNLRVWQFSGEGEDLYDLNGEFEVEFGHVYVIEPTKPMATVGAKPKG